MLTYQVVKENGKYRVDTSLVIRTGELRCEPFTASVAYPYGEGYKLAKMVLRPVWRGPQPFVLLVSLDDYRRAIAGGKE